MRNSFIISKKKTSILEDLNYKYLNLNKIHIYVQDDLEIIQTKNLIFIGYGVDTQKGKKITLNRLKELDENDIVKEIKYFSGRFVIILHSRWLYTDSTSSFNIYFDSKIVGNNLNLIYYIKFNKKIIPHKKLRDSLIIPPKTYVSEFNRLIPGQKLDLNIFKPLTINGLFEYQDFSIYELKSKIKELLISIAEGIEDLAKDDYLHMLTGGRDSRISLLAFSKLSNSNYNSFTHLKFLKKYNINDQFIVKKLVKKFKLNHFFTFPNRNYSFLDKNQIEETNPFISQISQEGSTWFYYRYGNMSKLKKTYLIDNYYEIGRMHFHKNIKGNNLKDYLIKSLHDSKHIEYILKHIHNLSREFDPIDLYYYIKNYVNVANQFELIDYSHNPMIFNNSAILISLMLSVPEEMRINGIFHDALIKDMSDKNYIRPNLISNSILYRGFNKIINSISHD